MQGNSFTICPERDTLFVSIPSRNAKMAQSPSIRFTCNGGKVWHTSLLLNTNC
jgi:hypothetical protein